jgi:hypothetical protein
VVPGVSYRRLAPCATEQAGSSPPASGPRHHDPRRPPATWTTGRDRATTTDRCRRRSRRRHPRVRLRTVTSREDGEGPRRLSRRRCRDQAPLPDAPAARPASRSAAGARRKTSSPRPARRALGRHRGDHQARGAAGIPAHRHGRLGRAQGSVTGASANMSKRVVFISRHVLRAGAACRACRTPPRTQFVASRNPS